MSIAWFYLAELKHFILEYVLTLHNQTQHFKHSLVMRHTLVVFFYCHHSRSPRPQHSDQKGSSLDTASCPRRSSKKT